MNPIPSFLAILITTTILLNAAEPQSPAAYWKLDGNARNTVSAASDGEMLHPQLLSPGSGKENRGTSFSFQNKQCGSIMVKNPELDFSKPFTIILAIKFHPDAQYNKFKEILCSSRTEFGPGIRLFSFYGKMILRSGDGKNISAIESKSTKHKMPLESWGLLAVVYDGLTAVIYLNGEEIASGAIKITSYRGPLYFGSYNGKHYPLQGELADIRVYRSAGNREMIQQDYVESLK